MKDHRRQLHERPLEFFTLQAAVLESEAKYLRMLQHPNILHCQAVLETKYDLVMVR
jgi:hypothetical protein